MGSLGSVATALNGDMGGLIKGVITAIVYSPIVYSIEFDWTAPMPLA
ncbi:hypothetical protein BDB13_2189 [Rhodococcus sp. OK302]|nr:hypothetical protein BDB13_2189 [Rhodococcus sp. OK302]